MESTFQRLWREMKENPTPKQRCIKSLEFKFGILIGSIITDRFIRNLDVEPYKNNINVSFEEFQEYQNRQSKLFKNHKDEVSKEDFKEWRDWVHTLQEKYLPKTIECHFEVEFELTNEVYLGIKDSIWGCDHSNYIVDKTQIGQWIDNDNLLIIKLDFEND